MRKLLGWYVKAHRGSKIFKKKYSTWNVKYFLPDLILNDLKHDVTNLWRSAAERKITFSCVGADILFRDIFQSYERQLIRVCPCMLINLYYERLKAWKGKIIDVRQHLNLMSRVCPIRFYGVFFHFRYITIGCMKCPALGSNVHIYHKDIHTYDHSYFKSICLH